MPFNSASDAFQLHPAVRSYGTILSGGGGHDARRLLRLRGRVLTFLDAHGKWSLVDAFVMILFQAAFQFHLELRGDDGGDGGHGSANSLRCVHIYTGPIYDDRVRAVNAVSY